MDHKLHPMHMYLSTYNPPINLHFQYSLRNGNSLVLQFTLLRKSVWPFYLLDHVVGMSKIETHLICIEYIEHPNNADILRSC